MGLKFVVTFWSERIGEDFCVCGGGGGGRQKAQPFYAERKEAFRGFRSGLLESECNQFGLICTSLLLL